MNDEWMIESGNIRIGFSMTDPQRACLLVIRREGDVYTVIGELAGDAAILVGRAIHAHGEMHAELEEILRDGDMHRNDMDRLSLALARWAIA